MLKLEFIHNYVLYQWKDKEIAYIGSEIEPKSQNRKIDQKISILASSTICSNAVGWHYC